MCRRIPPVLFLVSIVAAIFLNAHAAAADWVPLGIAAEPGGPSVTVLRSNESETVVRISIPGFWSEDVVYGDETYRSIRFPGYFTTTDIGKAQLPIIFELLAIPGSSGVRAHVVDYSTVSLDGYRIVPFQTPTYGPKRSQGFDLDEEFYRGDRVYPGSMVELGEPGIWRDLRIISLKAFPVMYNPARGELSICSELTVRIEYSGSSSKNTKKKTNRPIMASYDKMYRSMVLNYDFLDLSIEAESDRTESLTEDGYDYLIIAYDNYADNLAPFVDLKESLDLSVNVVPISQVGNDSESIKTFITNEYNNSGIRYVLLVGNEIVVRGYKGYGFFSDYYYSLVDGDDDYPDIAVGRFSAAAESQLDNIVSKCIAYESDALPGSWIENALLIAHHEGAPAKNSFQWVKEQIRLSEQTPSGTYSVLYPNFTTAYGALRRDGGDQATNADIVAAFNDGQRVVNYYGHGLEYCWGEAWNYIYETFSTDWVDSLSNGSMTPVVFSIACLTNDIEYDDPCLGEAFTRSEEGAVAFLGASRKTIGYINSEYDKKIFSLLFDEGVTNIGDATNAAAVYIINWDQTLYGLGNARRYLWFGDPSIDVIYREEAIPVPMPPTLLSPLNDVDYYTPPLPRYIIFDWEDLSTADYYQLMVDDDADFSSPIVNSNDLDSSKLKMSFSPFEEIGTYYWRARGANEGGWGFWSDIWHFNVVKRASQVPDPSSMQTMPARSGLISSFPNPFNPTTEIKYELHKSAHVSIAIFDVNGRHIATLVDCEKEAGRYHAVWNGTSDYGHKACSGLYFCQIRTGDIVESKKIILLR